MVSEKKYYYSDPESGELVEVSKAFYYRIQQLRRLVFKDGRPVGKIMVLSTVEDMDKQSGAELLWKELPKTSENHEKPQ